MFTSLVASKLMVELNPAQVVLIFFAYSLLGYIMECIVLTIENRQPTFNRGFVEHLPFCIIYGFGAMIGFSFLHPFRYNLLLLFTVGSICATFFEYFVAQIQIKLFGDFWWDYTQKPFNYKGILCIESTIGWGVVAIVVTVLLHELLVRLIGRLPSAAVFPLAFVLCVAYFADFVYSARQAKLCKAKTNKQELYSNQTLF